MSFSSFTSSSSPSSPCPLSMLILFVMVSVSKSVPMVDFSPGGNGGGGGGGEKEMATSSRSLYWEISSSSHMEKRSRDLEPVQLCGYRLLEAVRGLCRGNYVKLERRSDPDMPNDRVTMMMMRDSAEEPVYKRVVMEETEEGGATNGDHQSPVMIVKPKNSTPRLHTRYRRNIIDECCRKACSVNQMLRYCGTGN